MLAGIKKHSRNKEVINGIELMKDRTQFCLDEIAVVIKKDRKVE